MTVPADGVVSVAEIIDAKSASPEQRR
jgi:hypothetical protein